MSDESFGDWLKRQRRTLGWTQKELALHVNCSISTIRKIEAEERRPSPQTVERLAELFDIPEQERKQFLRFARGDWQAAPNAETEEKAFPPPRPNLARSMMGLLKTHEVEGLLEFTWDFPNVSEKLALLQRALAAAEAAGDIRRQIESLWQLGWLEQTSRFSYWETALDLTRRLGDAQGLASGLSTMGFFLVLNGDLNAAQKYLAESSELYQQLQLQPVTSHLLSAYGQISFLRGDFKRARAYLQEHARASLELGNREDYLWSYARLGYVAMHEGDLEQARHVLVESMQEFKKDKNIIGVVFSLEGLAGLYTALRHELQAARLIGWADSTRDKISDKRPLLEQSEIDKIVAACLAQVGDDAFSNAYQDGQKMTMDEAVSYVLRESK